MMIARCTQVGAKRVARAVVGRIGTLSDRDSKQSRISLHKLGRFHCTMIICRHKIPIIPTSRDGPLLRCWNECRSGWYKRQHDFMEGWHSLGGISYARLSLAIRYSYESRTNCWIGLTKPPRVRVRAVSSVPCSCSVVQWHTLPAQNVFESLKAIDRTYISTRHLLAAQADRTRSWWWWPWVTVNTMHDHVNHVNVMWLFCH